MAVMMMPEATIHKNDGTVPGKHEISDNPLEGL